MDKTHAYRPMLSMGFIMAACSCLLLTVQVGPDNATMIAIRFVSCSFTHTQLLTHSTQTLVYGRPAHASPAATVWNAAVRLLVLLLQTPCGG
jgi:uncharacterized membrane protein YjjP (DUF1212 family)